MEYIIQMWKDWHGGLALGLREMGSQEHQLLYSCVSPNFTASIHPPDGVSANPVCRYALMDNEINTDMQENP